MNAQAYLIQTKRVQEGKDEGKEEGMEVIKVNQVKTCGTREREREREVVRLKKMVFHAVYKRKINSLEIRLPIRLRNRNLTKLQS